MAKKADNAHEPSASELVQGILDDVQRLLHQQVDLIKQEVREEIGQAGKAAAAAGAGAGLLTLSGVLSAHMLVHLLHRSTRLPLWGCYGLVGGMAGAAGLAALADARRRAAAVQLAPPPETAAALRENLQWVKHEVTGRTR